MSIPIYKPISWVEAAELMADKGAVGKLFVQDEGFALFNPFEDSFNVGWLSKQNWYIRCEQEEQSECASSHHTHDNDLPIRPEVSE